MSIKNCEKSELLSTNLQTSKFVCRSSTDTGRRYETRGSEMKDSLLLTTITVARVSAHIALIPGTPFPTGRHIKGQTASAHAAWLQESNSEFRETAFCSKGRQYISQGRLLRCSIKCRDVIAANSPGCQECCV